MPDFLPPTDDPHSVIPSIIQPAEFVVDPGESDAGSIANGQASPNADSRGKGASGVQRTQPDIPEARSALVLKWRGKIVDAKGFFKGDYDRMVEDQKFLRSKQWGGAEDGEKYTANIVQRHIQQRTAALYAKNPKVVARRRKMLDFAMWDGTMASLNVLREQLMIMQQGGMTFPTQITQTLADIAQGVQRRTMIDKIASTLEIVFEYTMNQQIPPFKLLMKQLVRRSLAVGVGYVKLGYRRTLRKRPEDVERISDATEKLSTLNRLMADKTDAKFTDYQSQAEELRLLIADVEKTASDEIIEDGVVFDFPAATSVIIDPACRHLRTFLGAKWLAQEYILSVEDIQEIYGIDMAGAKATEYGPANEPGKGIPGLRQQIEAVANGDGKSSNKRKGGVCVWEVWDKTTGEFMVIADGYSDFLVQPGTPDVRLERFWPFFPLIFNDLESEEGIYPLSDVHLLKSMQKEYNRSREGMRQHRIANRPKTAVAAGMLDDEDIAKLQSHPANAVIQLNALAPGQKVSDVLQPIQGPPIEGALYDTTGIFEDVLRVVGTQEANLGGTGSATATESSIAESSRMSAIGSNVDDMDDLLTELARAGGQLLLLEMSADTAKQIAGPGAVWPELSGQEIAQELFLEVEAGSSGRPNRAAEIANFDKVAPILLQVPGISPEWLAKQAIRRLDDKLDPTDAIIASLPSIISQNAMATQMGGPGGGQGQGGQGGGQPQLASGNPSTDPSQQGMHGAQGGGPALPPGPSQTVNPQAPSMEGPQG